MTWTGVCPNCYGYVFELTINSDDDVHVNCASQGCHTYIGKMLAGTMLHPPQAEPH